ncbi:MAG: hypothetical protein MUC43_14660 [Pirellula sp.]|nr:hypothetical protein [Pirellula sp.]
MSRIATRLLLITIKSGPAHLTSCFNDTMRLSKLALAALATLSSSGFALAQDPLMELYGKGVHTYFRGDHSTGANVLSEAISAGLQDPRAFYFRGLCNMNTLGVESALADFEEGARLEMAGKTSVDVGRSLERIQGQARVEIEKARTKAKLAARSSILEQQRARLEKMLQKGGGSSTITPDEGTPFGANTNPLAPNDPLKAKPQAPKLPEDKPKSEIESDAFPATEPVKPADDDIFGGSAPATPAAPKKDEADPFAF